MLFTTLKPFGVRLYDIAIIHQSFWLLQTEVRALQTYAIVRKLGITKLKCVAADWADWHLFCSNDFHAIPCLSFQVLTWNQFGYVKTTCNPPKESQDQISRDQPCPNVVGGGVTSNPHAPSNGFQILNNQFEVVIFCGQPTTSNNYINESYNLYFSFFQGPTLTSLSIHHQPSKKPSTIPDPPSPCVGKNILL